MIILDKRKRLIAGVLGPREEEQEASPESTDELHAIVEELVNAIHAKDVGGVRAALKAAIHCCNGGEIKE